MEWLLGHWRKIGIVLSGLTLALVGICVSGASADVSNVGKLRITEYGSNAVGVDTAANRNQEFVRLTNLSGAPVDVTGWILHDTYQNSAGDFGNRYVFTVADLPASSPFRADHDSDPATADHFVVPAGGEVYVYQGSGTDTTPANTTAAIYRNHKHIWNNAGDTIYLRDASGTVVHWVRYTAYRVRIG